MFSQPKDEGEHGEHGEPDLVSSWLALNQPLLARTLKACQQFRANVYAGNCDKVIAAKAFQYRTDGIFIWLVVWNIFYFPIYWECHHPN